MPGSVSVSQQNQHDTLKPEPQGLGTISSWYSSQRREDLLAISHHNQLKPYLSEHLKWLKWQGPHIWLVIANDQNIPFETFLSKVHFISVSWRNYTHTNFSWVSIWWKFWCIHPLIKRPVWWLEAILKTWPGPCIQAYPLFCSWNLVLLEGDGQRSPYTLTQKVSSEHCPMFLLYNMQNK